jgi:IS4 transposase
MEYQRALESVALSATPFKLLGRLHLQPEIVSWNWSMTIWTSVLERFEQQAPASVMARVALEHALPREWIDTVFEEHRQRQYARELLFSTVIEAVTLVSLGLRPSLHAAARTLETLPVSVSALYDKVNRTEPAILRALVRGSAERLGPVAAGWSRGPSLPGWQLRVLDGNHLPASEKRLAPLRGHRGAALPGHTLVVYDPDGGLVTDIVPSEDAHQSERAAVGPLLDCAEPGQLWVADRQFCTRTILLGWEAAQASFLVREHGRHPQVAAEGSWRGCGRTDTGVVREQRIELAGACQPWRRIELTLDTPTEAGESVIRLWSNLPERIAARQIAQLYRRRWCVEGMFQRLEAALRSEIRSLGHPRAALLGFAVAVLAYNVLAVLQRCIEQVHRATHPSLQVSVYHLALQIRRGYDGMLIALPAEPWLANDAADPTTVAEYLTRLAHTVVPRQIAASPRGPKRAAKRGYVDAAVAREHVATARVLAQARRP